MPTARRAALFVVLLLISAAVIALLAPAAAKALNRWLGNARGPFMYARRYTLASGASATVALGYVPCRRHVPQIDPSRWPRIATRFSDGEDLDRMARVWRQLARSPDVANFIVPPVTDPDTGEILACGIDDVDFDEAFDFPARRPLRHALPPQTAVATYFERATGQSAYDVILRTGDEAQLTRLLFRCAGVLEFMHRQDVAHTDPHLGNFVVQRPLPGSATARVRAIDWADAVAENVDATREQSLRNLPNHESVGTHYVERSRFAPDAFTALTESGRLTIRHLKQLDVAMFGRSVINALHERAKRIAGGEALATRVEDRLVALDAEVFGGYVDRLQGFQMGDATASSLTASTQKRAIFTLPTSAEQLLARVMDPEAVAQANNNADVPPQPAARKRIFPPAAGE